MSKFTYYRNLILAVVCFVLAICIGYVHLTQENSGFPYREDLVPHQGYVDWVEEYKYGIRFAFEGDKYNFNYPTKSDGQGIVYDSLLNSKGKNIEVLFEANKFTKPIYTVKEFYDVFEIKVNNNIVRSYIESEKAWKSDNLLMPFIVALFLFGGPLFGGKPRKIIRMPKVLSCKDSNA